MLLCESICSDDLDDGEDGKGERGRSFAEGDVQSVSEERERERDRSEMPMRIPLDYSLINKQKKKSNTQRCIPR